MLQRLGDFEEWELADAARKYIDLYKKGSVCYVPYKDVPSGKKKFIKFVYEESTGWLYVDNDQ